ncbi:MAG: serine--tRNA ligase, partial [Polaromonas sp.]|nr:serine--tRNA ligase [Polaromonas sp.]
MLDINLLRKDLASAIARLETRKTPQSFLNVEAFAEFEAERKRLQVRTEELQGRRNSLSKQIGQMKGKGKGEDAATLMAEVGGLKDELDASAQGLDEIQTQLEALLLAVPNLPHASVPVGAGEAGNVEVRKWSPLEGPGGEPPAFAFEVRDHVDLGQPLGLDFELGAKLSGSRFSVLKGSVARLHRALSQFMLDVQTLEHGYTECYVPYIVNSDSLRGTGQLPKFEEDLFAAKKGGQEGGAAAESALYLIPTSEVPLTNFVRDAITPEAQLPLKFTAHSPCFRSEA